MSAEAPNTDNCRCGERFEDSDTTLICKFCDEIFCGASCFEDHFAGPVPTGFRERVTKDRIDAVHRANGKWRAYVVWIPMSTTPLNPPTVEQRRVVRDPQGNIVQAASLEALKSNLATLRYLEIDVPAAGEKEKP